MPASLPHTNLHSTSNALTGDKCHVLWRRLAVCSIVMSACSPAVAPANGTPVESHPLHEESADAQHPAWLGLFKPVMLRVARDGTVWIADTDDNKIHVFDSTGTSLREIDGAKHVNFIVDFALSDSSVIVLDSARHLSRFSLSGAVRPMAQTAGYEQALATLGKDRIVLANSAQWTGKLPAGRSAWPLARVMSESGDSLYDIGHRIPQANRYAAHIDNFVMPSGSQDGRTIWLAYLNSPIIAVYSTTDSSIRRVERPVPFAWRRMPPSFVPKGPKKGLPFDAVSLSIASDTTGHAYVLTAMAPPVFNSVPGAVAVDMIDTNRARRVQRLTFSGSATHVAVSPAGTRIYLLDTYRKRVRVFLRPK